MIVKLGDSLEHIGIKRRSGRYPWGSGDDPYQSYPNFRSAVNALQKEGMTVKQVADAFGMSIKDLKNEITVEKAYEKAENAYQAKILSDDGYGPTKIAERMGVPEPTVRGWLEPSFQERAFKLQNTTDSLEEEVKAKKYLDVGLGVEIDMGVKRTMLDASIYELTASGDYTLHSFKQMQQGTGKETWMKILTPSDVTWQDLKENKEKIRTVANWTDDDGDTYNKPQPVVSLNSDRIKVKFKEDGGADMDGILQIRRGAEDLSLGDKAYAQVRIAVDGSKYMKGMAIYGEDKDFPKGVDVIYNSNKSKDDPKGAFKNYESNDPTNPFGTTIRQKTFIDKDGNQQLSPMNRVGYSQKTEAGEEGAWATWSNNKTLPHQFLAKQDPKLAEAQLKITSDLKRDKFNEIMATTNPVVKQRLLDSFADSCDSDSVHMKAAGLPRQSTRVLLFNTSLKDDEVFAPGYANGTVLGLVRYPHAGTHEIPVLTVNNKNQQGLNVVKDSATKGIDSIQITPKTAVRLSGADADGDTVQAIVWNKKMISKPALDGMENFDTKNFKYPPSVTEAPGFKKMPDFRKQLLMGTATNLITDMNIKGASPEEMARATKYSMVAIDAQKHDLDISAAAREFRITELKRLYQGAGNGGASTLLSRANKKVNELATRPLKKGEPGYEDTVRRGSDYSVDVRTGKKVFGIVEPKAPFVNKDGVLITPKQPMKKVPMMNTVDDANELLSSRPEPIERIYANFANSMKSLGDEARKASANLKFDSVSPSAKIVYADEVRSLNAKLSRAQSNAPLERQAQILAEYNIKTLSESNPNLTKEQLKKLRGRELVNARLKVGAGKERVDFTEREWEAIQAQALPKTTLEKLLNNADLDKVQKMATPKPLQLVLSPAKLARAQQLAKNGYMMEDIAEAMGYSSSTISKALREAA